MPSSAYDAARLRVGCGGWTPGRGRWARCDVAGALECRSRQLDVGVRPGPAELAVDGGGFIVSVLRAQRLREAEERPSVVRVAGEIFAIDRLRVACLAPCEQYRSQLMPHGDE